MAPDQDPALFIIGFQDVNKKILSFWLLLFEDTFTSAFKDKKS
jgi:hypothetical protein